MIQELPLHDLQRILPLSEDFPYDICALRFALQDPHLRIFTDASSSPQVALLCPQRSPIAFVNGNPEFAPSLIDFVMNTPDNRPRLRFLSLPDDNWRQQIASRFPNRLYEKHRVSYTLADPQQSEFWLGQIPAGFRLQQIEKSLAERGPEYSQWFRSYWPDANEFAAQSLGYSIVHDGQMVSVAYLVQPTLESAEIVVETAPGFRGRGLAAMCCAALVQACLERHIQPHYSTDREHSSSASIAQKVGFGHEQFHCWLSGWMN